MPPGSQERDPLWGDLLLLEESPEDFLAEEILQRREVDVFGNGVEDRITGENTEAGERMAVGVICEAFRYVK